MDGVTGDSGSGVAAAADGDGDAMSKVVTGGNEENAIGTSVEKQDTHAIPMSKYKTASSISRSALIKAPGDPYRSVPPAPDAKARKEMMSQLKRQSSTNRE